MKRVVVVGGGAAGMMAAIAAAHEGAAVSLLEKTARLGFKIQISGGGRCNVTNAQTDVRELQKMFPGNGRFLQDALRRFTKDDLLALLSRHGVETKVEPPYGKVFPASDRARDVVAALAEEMRESGVRVRFDAPAAHVELAAGRATGVILASGECVPAGAVVVATGGRSFPRSGSTGDGYAMAVEVGHQLSQTFPSLVPLRVEGTRELSGVALRGVEGRTIVAGKPAGPAFAGDLLFTHFGLSGPLVLQLSRAAADGLRQGLSVELRIDVVPGRTDPAVEGEILAGSRASGRQLVATLMRIWLPKSAVGAFMRTAGIPEERRCADVTRAERIALVKGLKGWVFPVVGWHSFDGAEVTAGGVEVAEIDPKTFESRLVRGLHFAGEVIDVDGYVGGYNLQAAWSTGSAAGQAAARG